ncbi:MAG: EAL domain-containing protein [Telmatospirillum sp.]|nr:EAL domain-containing protein [Telmatospirillum sp.]
MGIPVPSDPANDHLNTQSVESMDRGRPAMKMSLAIDDATERALFERKLQESESRYRLLADNCSDMIACIDLEGRYLYVSPASYPLFGQTDCELIGRRASDFAHPEERDLLPAVIRDIVGGSGVRTLTFRRACKDGSYRWVESRAQGVRDMAGRVTQIILTARDISERRKIEEELRIAATAFEAQQGLVISAADGTILKVNKAFTEITGYAAADVVGQRASVLKSGRHNDAFFRAMWDEIGKTGTWRGEIWNRRKSGDVFPEYLIITAVRGPAGDVTHYVGAFTDITEHKAAEREIERLAFYDPLTRLPNRRLLHDRLEQALAGAARSNREGALMFIDLDNFKTINDTLGHDKGDELLCQVAERLQASVRRTDTVARLGGDEFVVMLEDLSCGRTEAAHQARAVADKILAALRKPHQIGTYEWESTPSIGISLFKQGRASVEDLLREADLAMYTAKNEGRNGVRFFDPEMQSTVLARTTLATELHDAVERGQLEVFYQPQVDRDGALTGAEALLRWHHPVRGLVPPDEFIPIAEETALILPIGQWVLEMACARLVLWADQEATRHLTLSVNVSACQFRQSDFVRQVIGTVERHGADPGKLKLELTESVLLDDINDAIAKMRDMKAHGLSISLDDFGTGYSSLAYLRSLPLSELKIDRSFVTDVHTDPQAAAIAKTIVFLGQSLGLSVIAEGVETQSQRDVLHSTGCADFQGYLFSRPLPLADFENYARHCHGISSKDG